MFITDDKFWILMNLHDDIIMDVKYYVPPELESADLNPESIELTMTNELKHIERRIN